MLGTMTSIRPIAASHHGGVGIIDINPTLNINYCPKHSCIHDIGGSSGTNPGSGW